MMTILKVIDQIEILNNSFINFKADEEPGVRQKRGILQGVLLLSAFRGVAIPQLPQIPGIPIIGWTQLLQHLFNERISIKTTLSQDTLIVEPLILNSYHALSLLHHCFLHLQSQFWSVKMMIRYRLAWYTPWITNITIISFASHPPSLIDTLHNLVMIIIWWTQEVALLGTAATSCNRPLGKSDYLQCYSLFHLRMPSAWKSLVTRT